MVGRLRSAIRTGLDRLRDRLTRGYPPLPDRFGLRPGTVLAIPARGQVVFRLVGRSEARPYDFQSNRDKGRPRWPRQDYVDYLGISVYGSEEAALRNATQYPKLIAEVVL